MRACSGRLAYPGMRPGEWSEPACDQDPRSSVTPRPAAPFARKRYPQPDARNKSSRCHHQGETHVTPRIRRGRPGSGPSALLGDPRRGPVSAAHVLPAPLEAEDGRLATRDDPELAYQPLPTGPLPTGLSWSGHRAFRGSAGPGTELDAHGKVRVADCFAKVGDDLVLQPGADCFEVG